MITDIAVVAAVIIMPVCTELGYYWETLGNGATATANEVGLCLFKVCQF